MKFIGVERDKETGYDATGPRFYDAWNGRFNKVDRFADKYPFISPYSYSLNNPICFSDASGDTVKFDDQTQIMHDLVYNQNRGKDKDGNIIYVNTTYRAQYDKLHSSDVVYNVQAGKLDGNRGGDFGTKDGKEITITLDVDKGANVTETLSHEFQHGIQFEEGRIWFAKADDGNWYTQNNSIKGEIEAYANQQKPITYTESDLRKMDPYKNLSSEPMIPSTRGMAYERRVRREPTIFQIVLPLK